MTSVTYAIVFSGDIVEGFQLITVKAHMAKLLNADAVKMQTLFSGKPVVMKRTADKAEAAKYGSALKKIGADVKVRIIKPTETAPTTTAQGQAPSAKAPFAKAPPAKAPSAKAPSAKAPSAKAQQAAPQAAPKAATQVTASSTANNSASPVSTIAAATFSLKHNDGNLFDATPEVPSPELNLSQFALAENDGSPIVEPSQQVERLDLDLSALSVAENDDTPLAEPGPEVEKIMAPDFGLDELGAVLETIKEQVDLANPDTSGMSLAFPGTDLLNQEEKDQGPPPVSPDTSKINLVPNFD
ncbi:MAG: hypothetical protein P8R02_10750 [Pseudomonadales bacterium]|nr:hypothetical protein [Pseudomonadales bacterium]